MSMKYQKKQRTIVGIDYSLNSPAICIVDNSFDFNKCSFHFLTSKKKHIGKFGKNIFGYEIKEYSIKDIVSEGIKYDLDKNVTFDKTGDKSYLINGKNINSNDESFLSSNLDYSDGNNNDKIYANGVRHISIVQNPNKMNHSRCRTSRLHLNL